MVRQKIPPPLQGSMTEPGGRKRVFDLYRQILPGSRRSPLLLRIQASCPGAGHDGDRLGIGDLVPLRYARA